MTKKQKDEAIETIRRLGLTFCQARIYLALLNSGESQVTTISKTSGVARAEVYRTMPSLQKLGLAEKVLSVPIKFKATPVQDGLNILLKQENSRYLKLQKKVMQLARNFKENNERTESDKENQFVIAPGKDAHIKWLKNRFDGTKKMDDTIVTWNDNKVLNFFCDKEIQNMDARGVKTRLIIYASKKEKAAYENDQSCKNTSNSRKRIIFTPPLVLGGVFDRKIVVIATTLNNPIQNAEDVLRSNNPLLVGLFQNYFDTLWKTAIQENPKKAP